MDVRQLRAFLAVVDHGGFRRAADAMHVAQPSVSQTIATFERELGVPLFHRVGRGVVLSAPGQDLVGPARAVLRNLEEAEASVADARAMAGGRLDVISMASPGIEPLTTILAAFARDHPDVRVRVVRAYTPERVVEAVRSGESEVGLMGSSDPAAVGDLRRVGLGSETYVLVSPPGSTGTGSGQGLPPTSASGPGGVVTQDRLAGLRLIVTEQGSLSRAVVDRVVTNGLALDVAIELEHRTSMLPFVLAGLGHAVVSSSWTNSARMAGAEVRRIVPGAQLHMAAISRRDGLTPAAAAVMAIAAALPA